MKDNIHIFPVKISEDQKAADLSNEIGALLAGYECRTTMMALVVSIGLTVYMRSGGDEDKLERLILEAEGVMARSARLAFSDRL